MWTLAIAGVLVAGGVIGYLLINGSTTASSTASSSTPKPPSTAPPAATTFLAPPSDGRFSVAAQIALRRRAEYRAASSATGSLCIGVARYRDIHGGTRVVVAAPSGRALATTRLMPGYLSSDAQCVFPFTARVLPGRGPYRVRISNRRAYVRTEAQLRSLVLTLG